MNPKIHASSNPARRSQLKLRLKICAAGCLVFLLTLLVGVGIPILRECFRPIAPPSFEDTASDLLVRADPQTPGTILTVGTATTRNASLTHTTTTAISSTTPSSSTLRFKPFIPDTSDLPAKLRSRQSTLNIQFDNLLCEIEKYEKNKRILSYEEARERFNQIEKQEGSIWDEIFKITDGSFPKEGWTGEVFRRYKEYLGWEMAAEAEVNIKGQRWIVAGNLCEGILRENHHNWEIQQLSSVSGQPIFGSDYYRQSNSQDWDRMIGCYRQSGDMNGYVHIMSAVYRRQKEKLLDVLGRGEMATRKAMRGR